MSIYYVGTAHSSAAPKADEDQLRRLGRVWEFPENQGTLFWVPYNKDPTIWGTILGFKWWGFRVLGGEGFGNSGGFRV